MFDHPPPDLTTKAGRKAYRHELRMVAMRPRRWGLRLMVLGALLLALPTLTGTHDILGWSPRVLGLFACLASVPLLVASVILRTRHHRGRMRLHRPAD